MIGGGILALGWFLVTRPSTPESEIILKEGIHWPADLTIKNQKGSPHLPPEKAMRYYLCYDEE